MNKLLALAKRSVARLDPSRSGFTGRKRLRLSLELLLDQPVTPCLIPLHEALSALPDDEREWWVGYFHTLLMPSPLRRRLAAHFTPPPVVRRILALVMEAGLDLTRARVIDPAAGGAAFLSTVAGAMREQGLPVNKVLSCLRGVELDPYLASLSEAILAHRLGLNSLPRRIVTIGNALSLAHSGPYDAVLANPPYGRLLGLSRANRLRWSHLADPGHVNLYALFVGLALELLRPSGLAALVLPASFLAGPLYTRLRMYLRTHSDVLSIDVLDNRNEVFFDVSQDTCVLLLRKGQGRTVPRWGLMSANGSHKPLGRAPLPKELGAPWAQPIEGLPPSPEKLARLSDWGIRVKAGYFVWNRERHRMSKTKRWALDVPLIWAENVQPDTRIRPAAKKGKSIDFVRFNENSPAIIREPAVLLQRTTNNRQHRRLIAAEVDPSVLEEHGGFVTENHTIVLLPTENGVNLELVAKLLGSAAVDTMYRRVAGTANISVKSLRELPLPWSPNLKEALARRLPFDEAVFEAYRMPRKKKAA